MQFNCCVLHQQQSLQRAQHWVQGSVKIEMKKS